MSVYFYWSRLVSSVRCASEGDYQFPIGNLLNINSITRETRGKSRQLTLSGKRFALTSEPTGWLPRVTTLARSTLDDIERWISDSNSRRFVLRKTFARLVEFSDSNRMPDEIGIFKNPRRAFEKENAGNIYKASQRTRGAFASNR
ncbi:hypothetical protein [Burkholderia plantarii]|uniref:hypothetical protein n=1 Tax=Burkholderia plantarii TaxID=41899 RepID=UPI0018DB3BCB|nr:hypothetical protein [Burkholderia plantarii]MBI0328553.1 hypothetical protein [Burkholderia plantarii]